MAKLTYLELTNRILRRINQADIADVASATGHALIIGNLINEAQIQLYSEVNWYSLYTTRTFDTVASTATYAVASDWGKSIDLMDTTNNRALIEDVMRAFDEEDPNNDYTGIPTHFSLMGEYFRLYPIPAGIYTIRDRYWKVPTALSANGNQSDLPIECENCLIHWAWYKMLEYQNKFESADRIRLEYEKLVVKAKNTNEKHLNNMHIFSGYGSLELLPPRWPSGYPR